ncbi:hypothetical protein PSEUBRA_002056 [Kalmanozyma brasiliensis GHG001]|uniref:uncharacterized protein n=1 Tax=Kalmanozyma brasiliensis (strain GHG001) TaxID=1365824 RepID=UPI001CEAEED5|nr:uncharacterized protein PSEUBRA_002056 [Kalmanozyma brasiliensis GHG001]EST08305.2 hypothetical protein PSEUBRA_002056 [Kalmanozyma brasiliensis GHG001]
MFGSQFQTQPFGQSTPGYYPHMNAQQHHQQQQQQQQQNQFAWMQYQQMLQAQHFYSQQQQQQHQQQAHAASASDIGTSADSRRRTSSTPQRPQPVTYNDTFRRDQQQSGPGMAPVPGASYAGNMAQFNSMRNLNGQPVTANQYGQVPASGHSASSSVSSAPTGGFHPYRRTQRGTSDVGVTGSQNFPSSVSAANSMAPPAAAPRNRTSSAASQSSSRETSPMLAAERKRGVGALPSSTSAPGIANGHASKNVPASTSSQAGLSHLRGAPPRTNSQSSIGSDASSRTATASNSVGNGAGAPVHQRSDSSASLQSINTSQRGQPASIASSKKPSPLSRQAAKDDDEEAVYGGSDDDRVNGGRSTPMPGYAPKPAKKSGLSSKLRKALSFSNMNDIQDSSAHGTSAAAAARRPQNGGVYGRDLGGLPNSSGDTNASTGSTRSTSPPRTPDNGAAPLGSSGASITSRRTTRPPLSNNNEGKRSIFNRKFNSSTDNISISSTVSSASVMLRKVGNLGKLARRHSLMGLTNMFNKDKDGRDADSYGAMPTASDDSAINTKSKKSTKKGTPASASITHATVELESARSNDTGMTPAASYVRQHQLQMQAQAEAEARAARERQEAEARAREAGENRQKMIEKEKERLKSKRGWRKKFGSSGGGSISSITSDAPSGLETTYAEPEHYVDASTGQQNADPLVSAAPPQIAMPYDGDGGFDASFDSELLEPPHMPAAGGLGGEDSGDEFETDSLRHWGEGIERSRASAAQFKNPRSILKKTASTPDLSLAGGFEKPFAGRIRANSYDAPLAASPTTLQPSSTMTHISSSTAGVERLDGVGAKPESPASSRPGSRSGADGPARSASPGSIQHAGGVLGHHSNSSMPTLSLMMDPSSDFMPQRSVTAPTQAKKKLSFADDLIFHSTWPATVYDRRGEQATCNRLTPLLAQRIKEELNTYKMEEMAVAPTSRIYTHFFV